MSEAVDPDVLLLREGYATDEAGKPINLCRIADRLENALTELSEFRQRCGGENCFGWKVDDHTWWVTRDRLQQVEQERDAARAALATAKLQRDTARAIVAGDIDQLSRAIMGVEYGNQHAKMELRTARAAVEQARRDAIDDSLNAIREMVIDAEREGRALSYPAIVKALEVLAAATQPAPADVRKGR